MRNTIVFISVLFMCSCHSVGTSLRQQQDEFLRALEESQRQGGVTVTVGRHNWSFRGPLATPGQVEKDMIEQGLDEETMTEYPEWNDLKGKYRKGDKFYFYLKTSVGEVHFAEGYVLVRNKQVVGWVVIYGN